jgi:hypothetical protein
MKNNLYSKSKYLCLKICSILITLTLTLPSVTRSQEPRAGIFISNNVTSFPVTRYPKVFYSQFHPGIDICREWKLNKKEKNQFWLTANAGGFYHRFIQTAVRLYATVEYHYVFNNSFTAFAGLGGGYLHSFENMAVLKMNDDGKYEVKSSLIGRPQILGQFNLGCSYAIKKDDANSMRILLQLKTYVQGPFVKNYVPMLPLNSFALGLSIPLKCKKNEK